ncbi:MAG: ATP-binding protein [Chloroflexi bacterium]|nr:ATP-binding protein [Chloroflexota bacterium]
MLNVDVATAFRGSPQDEAERDVVPYAVQVSVWARWVAALVAAVTLVYRPEFWYPDQISTAVLLIPVVVVNGLAHCRLLLHRPMTRSWMFLLGGLDVAVLSATIATYPSFDRFVFVGYYPALAMFVLVFASARIALGWTTVTAAACTAATLLAAGGLDFDTGEERALLSRVAAMYVLVLCVLLITRFERALRQATLRRERRLHRERIELSQEVHNTIAQTAYLLEQGIRRARRLADGSNEELTAALDASWSLSTSAIWEARRLADSGRLFEGRTLGPTLRGHCETFERVTGVPVGLSQSGTEPPLPVETSSQLFSIAHNALTNAARHARAEQVWVNLDFETEGVRLSVADDGVGLPNDYLDRGHGFRGMAANAEALGGTLTVRSGDGGASGTTVSCAIPLTATESGG